MKSKTERFEEIDSRMPRIEQFWMDLSRVTYRVAEGESLLERVYTPPWESEDPEITEAWNALISPSNLTNLRKWGEGNLNPMARRYTDKAIEMCEERSALK